MNFVKFPVAGTNIFPISNSKAGGQLATEFNLRSREMVATHAAVKYDIGPSFVHSAEDFQITLGANTSSIVISEGRAVLNGHFVETLVPIVIDLLEANATLKSKQQAPLKGELEVGIRIFYSTAETMAGAMLIENDEDMYQGVQIVILPKGEMKTPIDTPTDINKVNAHIKLGTFTFLNGEVQGVNDYGIKKCRYIPAERLDNIDSLLSDTYITKSGLNPKRLYSFSGKGTDPETGYDTWCDSTDALMVWDNTCNRTLTPPSKQAEFGVVQGGILVTQSSDNNTVKYPDGTVVLAIPHKQIDGMTDNTGNREYYADRTLKLPVADYNSNTSGTVNAAYTEHIKSISKRLNEFHQIVKGKQVSYLAIHDENNPLPTLNAAWSVGDYVLVGEDHTAELSTDGVRPPSTMYVVLPGLVKSIKYKTKVVNSDEVPSGIVGAELGHVILDKKNNDSTPSTTTDPTTYPTFYADEDELRGVPSEDYFVATYIDGDTYTKYYYVVETAGKHIYSDYLPLTGEIPLAQENVIGGFYNVPYTASEAQDGGYVYLDENGHLRLVDYALLRTGVLAYQLGQNWSSSNNVTTEELQAELDEYVNQRVAFPNIAQAQTDRPNVIDIYITLCAEDTPQTLNIYDIDSRFNTSVCLHIEGEANSNTTVNIVDCQKIRIDNNISGSPVINLYRSSLYYDPTVINYIRTCPRANTTFKGIEGLKLWYEMFDEGDANLLVDNMTVSELDAPIVSQEIDFWNQNTLNDNHYRCALSSITFSSTGELVRCQLLVCNQSTNNIEPGHKIVTSEFSLPQGSGLTYPIASMTKRLKITGTFVSAYPSEGNQIVSDTHFTALTNVFDEYGTSPSTSGSIAFHSEVNVIPSNVVTTIEEWAPDTYHIFQGGIIS